MPGPDFANKIGLVGMGMVGSSFAYAVMQSGVADELVLIDADAARAEGEAMDLNHGLPFVGPMKIHAGGYEHLAGSAVVVITAGANQGPGESRLDLLAKNAGVIRDVVPKIVAANPGGLILVASNPVDILTQIAADLAGLPEGRVLGSGTILDTARLRFLLGEYYGVDPRSVHAYIVGEHGDSSLPVWSLANIAGVRLPEFQGPRDHRYNPASFDTIVDQTRNAAYEIIKRKKSTYYAIGLGLLTLVVAILKNQRSVLTVSSPMLGRYGLTGMAASLPTVVGRLGAMKVLEIPMSNDEIKAFQHSVQALKLRLDLVS